MLTLNRPMSNWTSVYVTMPIEIMEPSAAQLPVLSMSVAK
jgi:hypothetical protein